MKKNVYVSCIAFALFSCGAQGGTYSLSSSVQDGIGIISTGTTYTSITSIAQPGGITISAGSAYISYSGYLSSFAIRTNLDTDHDGLVDEWDFDNDGDALSDASEISGDGFSPATVTDVNNPDTDSDSVNDSYEQTAGTDPTDDNSYLHITSITRSGSSNKISWLARSGKTYNVLALDGKKFNPTNTIATNMTFGGTSPWFVITNSIVDTDNDFSNRFYGVQVIP